jgi:hypothetical protein
VTRRIALSAVLENGAQRTGDARPNATKPVRDCGAAQALRGAQGGEMVRGLRKAWLVLLLLGLAVPLAAQTSSSGSVQGTVKDSQGGVLPGVTVTAYSDALVSRHATTVTDGRGVYRFPSLPPGTYAFEAALAGFRKVRQDGVRVSLAQALSLDLTLTMATLAEQVTVAGEAPVVSVVANSVSTYIDNDFIDRQPIVRNFYTMLSAAPAVNGLMAYGGTEQRQNAYTLDGVNVSDPGSGEYWVMPSIEWLQEIQIGGLGANAEYGGYTGGVINAVTKSGGNEFHGAFEYYYEPKSWVSHNSPDFNTDEFSFNDASLSVGGPIKKDKLWFFVSGEYWKQVTTPLGAVTDTPRTIPRFIGKLTWQKDESNRFMVMLEHDDITQDYRTVSTTVLPEAAYKEEAPNATFAMSWESLVNSSNFLDLKLTGFDGRIDHLPYHGLNTPGHIDSENTGIAWGNLDINNLSHRHLMTFDASWNLFKDGLFGGKDSHSFKFGAIYENGAMSDNWNRNGGFTYYDDSSSCASWAAYVANPSCGAYYVERGYGEYNERMKYTGLSAYAQDSLRLNRFTINVGLRYGSYKAGWDQPGGTGTVYDVNFIDPRIGLVWDASGNGRSALKAHWGRYHSGMETYLFDREASGKAATPDQDCYWNSKTGKYDDCDPAAAEYATMGKVNHPYVDEALLTFEQQLGKDMALGVDVISRRWRDLMAMVNVNQDYTTKTATNNPFGGGTLPIYVLNSPYVFVLTTDNPAYRDMKSAILRFDKRYSDGWQLKASLVWIDLKGNNYKTDGYAPEFLDKNNLTNADGQIDLSYYTWEGKLFGAVDLPLGLVASANYTYLSGWKEQPYVRVTSGLNYNSGLGRNIDLTTRGSLEMPDRHLLDVRLAKSIKLSHDLKLTVQGEAFNLSNKNTTTDIYNRWGSYNAKTNTWSGPRSNYYAPYSIETPRELRLGVRLEF